MIIVDTTVDSNVHIAEDMIVSFQYDDIMPHNWILLDGGMLKYSGDSEGIKCNKSGAIFHVNKNTWYSVKWSDWTKKIKSVRQLEQMEINSFSWGVTIYTTATCGWHHCYFDSKEEQLKLVEKMQNAIELREYNLRVQSDYAGTALHRIQGR